MGHRPGPILPALLCVLFVLLPVQFLLTFEEVCARVSGIRHESSLTATTPFRVIRALRGIDRPEDWALLEASSVGAACL